MQSVWKFDTYWLYKHRVSSVQSLKEHPFPWYHPHCTMELPFSSIHNKGLQIHLNYSSDSNHPKTVPKKETRIQINSWKSFVKWVKYLRNLKIHLDVIMINDKLEKMKINKTCLLFIWTAHITDLRIYNLIFDIIFQKIKFPQSTYTPFWNMHLITISWALYLKSSH